MLREERIVSCYVEFFCLDFYSSTNGITSLRVQGNLGKILYQVFVINFNFEGADGGGSRTTHGPYNRPNGFTGYAEQVFGQNDPT